MDESLYLNIDLNDTSDLSTEYLEQVLFLRWEVEKFQARLNELKPLALEEAQDLLTAANRESGTVLDVATGKVVMRKRTVKPSDKNLEDYPDLYSVRADIEQEERRLRQENAIELLLMEQRIADLVRSMDDLISSPLLTRLREEERRIRAQYTVTVDELAITLK